MYALATRDEAIILRTGVTGRARKILRQDPSCGERTLDEGPHTLQDDPEVNLYQ